MTVLLEARGLRVAFPTGSQTFGRLLGRPRSEVVPVDNIDLEIAKGSSVAIVGESGCGKSTLAKALIGLTPIEQGSIALDGRELRTDRTTQDRLRIQMVFQDPGASLNPSLTIEQMLSELLRVHAVVPKDEIHDRVVELLEMVELPSTLLKTFPGRLSGGQRQRIGIARALALEPDLLIADEAVAALDVSVQASILNLLVKLRSELDLTMLFISHDLAVVKYISDRVLVMYLGRIVEDRPTADLFMDPRHPYTRALISAAPRLHAHKEPGSSVLQSELPDPSLIPSGCRFHPRCPVAVDECNTRAPELDGPTHQQRVACHLAWVKD